MRERWLSVPGWPGYEVSDLGRVRSVPRILPDGRRAGGVPLQQFSDAKGDTGGDNAPAPRCGGQKHRGGPG